MIRSVLNRFSLLWPYVLFGMIAACVPLFWYQPGTIIYFWDQTFPLDPLRNLVSLFSIWHPEYEFGRIDATAVAFIPYFAYVAFLKAITGSLATAQSLYISSLILASCVSMYWLCIYLFTKKNSGTDATVRTAATISAVIYVLNAYTVFFIFRIINSTLFVLAFFPLCAYFILRYCETSSPRYLAYIALFSVCMSPGLSNVAMVPVLALCALGLLYGTSTKLTIKKVSLILLSGFSGCAFWLLPVITNVYSVSDSGSFGGVTTALISNSKHLEAGNALRMLGSSPSYEAFKGEQNFAWVGEYSSANITLTTLVPIFSVLLVFLALFMYSPNKYGAVFFGSFLVSLFFAKGTAAPFGYIFLFAFTYVPLFAMYRDPYSKFGFAAIFFFSIITGLALCILRQHAKRLYPLLLVSSILCIILFGWPIISGSIVRPSGEIRPAGNVLLPVDYKIVAELIKDSGNRVLSFPKQELPLQSSIWEHGYVGYDPLRTLSGAALLSTSPTSPLLRAAFDALYEEIYIDIETGLRLARNMNVGWILVRKDNNDAFSLDERFDLTEHMKRLDTNNTLSRVYDGTHLRLYAFKSPLPKVRSVTRVLPVPLEANGAVVPVTSFANIDGRDYANDERRTEIKLEDFIVDAGDQRITYLPSPQGGHMITAPHSSFTYGSLRTRSAYTMSSNMWLAVSMRTRKDAYMSVSGSRFVDGIFIEGASLTASNPPLLSRGTSYASEQLYTLLFPIGQLAFVPNTLHIQISAADNSTPISNRTVVVDNVELFTPRANFNARMIEPISFVTTSGGTKQVIDLPITPLSSSQLEYIAFDAKTESASLLPALSRRDEGLYITGESLRPEVDSRFLTELGTVQTNSVKKTLYFKKSTDDLRNTLHLNIYPENHSGQVQIDNIRAVQYAGSISDTLTLVSKIKSTESVSRANASVHASISIESFTAHAPYLYSITYNTTDDTSHALLLSERFDPAWRLVTAPQCANNGDSLFSQTLQSLCVHFSGQTLRAEHTEMNGVYNGWIIPSFSLQRSGTLYIIHISQIWLICGLVISFFSCCIVGIYLTLSHVRRTI